jgi:hypothetical protein
MFSFSLKFSQYFIFFPSQTTDWRIWLPKRLLILYSRKCGTFTVPAKRIRKYHVSDLITSRINRMHRLSADVVFKLVFMRKVSAWSGVGSFPEQIVILNHCRTNQVKTVSTGAFCSEQSSCMKAVLFAPVKPDPAFKGNFQGFPDGIKLHL